MVHPYSVLHIPCRIYTMALLKFTLHTQVTLNFVQFLTALRHVAAALRVSLNEVMEVLVLINAPLDT
jgi:hypothetical protein